MVKRLGRWLTHTFSTRFPTLYYNLVQRPRLLSLFRTEKKLAAGAKLSRSSQTSILFFTTQKCASQYVTSMLSRLSASAGLIRADYDSYVAMIKVPRERNPFSGALEIAFQPQGYFYGAIGTYRAIPNMEQYRVLLQLRDPRDLLTSLYYSTAYSHAIINEKLLRRRREALAQDVDTFVLAGVDEYLKIFNGYIDYLLEQENVLFVKYEDMVADFSAWLQAVSTHLGLEKEKAVLQILRDEANFQVEREDKFSQRRQVTPGDHQRKLKPETVSQLNQHFSTVLERLGYTR